MTAILTRDSPPPLRASCSSHPANKRARRCRRSRPRRRRRPPSTTILRKVGGRFGALALSQDGTRATYYICQSRLWKNCDNYRIERAGSCRFPPPSLPRRRRSPVAVAGAAFSISTTSDSADGGSHALRQERDGPHRARRRVPALHG